jgi:hypothetical protein
VSSIVRRSHKKLSGGLRFNFCHSLSRRRRRDSKSRDESEEHKEAAAAAAAL